MKLNKEKVHLRTVGGTNKAAKVRDRIETAVNVDDLNKLQDKYSDKFCSRARQWRTIDFSSLPKWLQDNHFILKGYRPVLPSFRQCFLSVFRIHTETVNIWTHLLGCLLFIALFLRTALGALPLQDKLALSVFFAGAIFCLGSSSLFHTIECHSQRIKVLFNHLDYCGINVLIGSTLLTWFYYIFFCDTKFKILYLAGTLALGTRAVIVSLSTTFSLPHNISRRVRVFTYFGLSGAVPVTHFVLTDGWDGLIMVAPLILTGFLYFVGAVIYALRVPERMFPGKCDIWFQSHHVLHVMCLLATATNYIGIVRVAEFVRFGRNNPDFCQRNQFYYEILKDYASDFLRQPFIKLFMLKV